MIVDVGVELSSALTANLYDDLAGAVAVDFIADVVNAVLDENRAAQALAPETLMLEVRRRMERFSRASSSRLGNRQSPRAASENERSRANPDQPVAAALDAGTPQSRL